MTDDDHKRETPGANAPEFDASSPAPAPEPETFDFELGALDLFDAPDSEAPAALSSAAPSGSEAELSDVEDPAFLDVAPSASSAAASVSQPKVDDDAAKPDSLPEPTPEPAPRAASAAEPKIAAEKQLPEQTTPRERITHVVFHLLDQRYAVDMNRLLELDRMTPVTPVPHTPDFIMGVTNLRGEIVSVIDLRRLFGMESMERPETGRVLKLRDSRDLLVSGVLVDGIQGARTIKPEQIQPAQATKAKWSRMLEGVYEESGEQFHVLDVDKLFESDEIRVLTGA